MFKNPNYSISEFKQKYSAAKDDVLPIQTIPIVNNIKHYAYTQRNPYTKQVEYAITSQPIDHPYTIQGEQFKQDTSLSYSLIILKNSKLSQKKLAQDLYTGESNIEYIPLKFTNISKPSSSIALKSYISSLSDSINPG